MSLFDIIINIFEVLPKDIENMNQGTLIQAPLITAFFYFISRWFRAYVLRLGLFLFGSLVVFQVLQGQSFLNRFDFYAGLGILLPHIPIVELTYLILRERTLLLYEKLLSLFFSIVSPVVWLYGVSRNMFSFFKAKQDEKNYQHEKEQYEQKSKAHEDAQRSKQEKQKQNKRQAKQEPPKKEKQKTHEWWESSNHYEVLQLKDNADKSEIEKAKKKLRKMYHPDLVFTNEEKRKKHTIIFQNVNNAYDELMKKF